MRFVTFRAEGRERVGVLLAQDPGLVVDLSVADPGLPDDLATLLAGGTAMATQVEAALAAAPSDAVRALAHLELLAPVPRPGKIACVGYNYRGHSATGEEVADPEYPDIFVKTANTVNHPGAAIPLPRASQQVDYEAELAVVIGREAHEVALDDALGCIGGYTVINDVSARDWQDHGSQWGIAKCFDGFAPMGPALVTPDEVGDVQDLSVEARVNGETTIRSTTSAMVFSVAFLVSYLSQVMTLRPGDVIATGTPQKLAEILACGPRWLRDGDVVEISFGHVGTLSNPVAGRPGSTEDAREGERP